MSRHDIYYAGDTDFIPEMEHIGCDIAILPVGGTTTMGWEEAAKAAAVLKPGYVIPMHYGREVPGSWDDGRRFCLAVNSGSQAIELQIENDSVDVTYQ
jgi:L-ascorbate metabolism protein UlaG (beta-lactamase superfamily)